ncbi:hypothetical protein PSTG_03297 [Puccinia striiformis f. sp. tritici PST-78]|uniref:Uncharacterized protein n=1 Tax=Puccinia striiformis f. sp. tritici PST-78 TaxID=1165861 RepID=A0A0L0VVM5_9BASI|nr:hypothetical protein PSTG_03297 [Puccinia striiformis f. sp. tritici PST-78]
MLNTRVNDWKVSDKVNIDTEDKFNEWLMTTIEWKRFTVQLALFMPNPADQVKRGKKADILAKQAAHKLMLKESKSQKRQSANDNDSEPDDESEPEEIKPEDRDDVAFHKKNIYEKYKLKIDYDRYSPVFLDPPFQQTHQTLPSTPTPALSLSSKCLSTAKSWPTIHFLSPKGTKNTPLLIRARLAVQAKSRTTVSSG